MSFGRRSRSPGCAVSARMGCIRRCAMKIKIKLVKSAIGCPKDQKETVLALGLKKLNSESIQEDSASIRGMIFKVKHLVTVEEVK